MDMERPEEDTEVQSTHEPDDEDTAGSPREDRGDGPGHAARHEPGVGEVPAGSAVDEEGGVDPTAAGTSEKDLARPEDADLEVVLRTLPDETRTAVATLLTQFMTRSE